MLTHLKQLKKKIPVVLLPMYLEKYHCSNIKKKKKPYNASIYFLYHTKII